MAFTLTINAARHIGFQIIPSTEGTQVVISYALCRYTPGDEEADPPIPTVWEDVSLGNQAQQGTVMLAPGDPTPPMSSIAAFIQGDTLAKFGTAVDNVLVAGVLY